MEIKTKDKKGISLIVLVITIIVMIILASAIIISLSNNGIIDKAKNAVNLSNEKQVQEVLEITVALLKQENKLDETNLKEELKNSFNEGVEVTKDTDGSYIVGIKETYFTIEDGKIIKGKYDKWDGTSTKPTNMTNNEIHIYKASELKWVQEEIAEGTTFEGYTIYLENNLDLGARESVGDTKQEKWKTEANKLVKWTPIGKTKELALKAKFEGNDHIIKGVYVEETTNFNGIFGRVANTVQNLIIKNSYIEGASCTGGIVGITDYDVINCHNVDTTVVLIEGENNQTVGGVVGLINGDITNCTNSGNIFGHGMFAGGIVGASNERNITNCTNSGNIFGYGMDTGGIVGSSTGNIANCINSGNIFNEKNTEGKSFCGGIVGGSVSAIIKECYNIGNIEATGRRVGGIVGCFAIAESSGITTSNSYLEKCYNRGSVKGKRRYRRYSR